jgi:hypothetical protein
MYLSGLKSTRENGGNEFDHDDDNGDEKIVWILIVPLLAMNERVV